MPFPLLPYNSGSNIKPSCFKWDYIRLATNHSIRESALKQGEGAESDTGKWGWGPRILHRKWWRRGAGRVELHDSIRSFSFPKIVFQGLTFSVLGEDRKGFWLRRLQRSLRQQRKIKSAVRSSALASLQLLKQTPLAENKEGSSQITPGEPAPLPFNLPIIIMLEMVSFPYCWWHPTVLNCRCYKQVLPCSYSPAQGTSLAAGDRNKKF